MIAKYLQATIFFDTDTADGVSSWIDWIDSLVMAIKGHVTCEEQWHYTSPSLKVEQMAQIDTTINRADLIEHLKTQIPLNTNTLTVNLYKRGSNYICKGDAAVFVERSWRTDQHERKYQSSLIVNITIHKLFWEQCDQLAFLHFFKTISVQVHALYAFVDIAPISTPRYELCPYLAFGDIANNMNDHFIPSAYWASLVCASHFELRDKSVSLETYLTESPCEVVEKWTHDSFEAYWLQLTQDSVFSSTYYTERMWFRNYFQSCIPILKTEYIENEVQKAYSNPYRIHLLPVRENEYAAFDATVRRNRYIQHDRKIAASRSDPYKLSRTLEIVKL